MKATNAAGIKVRDLHLDLNHSSGPQKRAHAIAAALLQFVDESGRIPQSKLKAALRSAVLAGQRTWGQRRILDFADRYHLIAPAR